MPDTPLDRWLNACMGRGVHEPAPTAHELQAWQFAKLRATVASARCESPYYRDALAHLDLSALRGPADMALVPRMDAASLRVVPERLLCVSQDEIERVVTLSSSGSTGAPKRLFFTADDLERTVDFFHHGMENMADRGVTVLALLPAGGPESVGHLLVRAVERLGARCLCCAKPWDVPAALEMLQLSGARAVVGAPAHVHALSRLWAARKEPRGQVHHVLLCWDAVPSGLPRRVEEAFGAQVLTHWGMTETGLGGAVDCGAGTGMHLREADMYVEITDSQTGEPLPDGQWGEMVMTTLTRRGMPLVRYRTGDRGRIVPSPCPCGSPLRLLDRVPGRLVGGVPLQGGGSLVRRELDEAVLCVPGILDFEPRYSRRRGALQVSLSALPGARGVEVAVRRALGEVPGLKELKVDITDLRVDGHISPGFGKRAMHIEQTEDAPCEM